MQCCRGGNITSYVYAYVFPYLLERRFYFLNLNLLTKQLHEDSWTIPGATYIMWFNILIS